MQNSKEITSQEIDMLLTKHGISIGTHTELQSGAGTIWTVSCWLSQASEYSALQNHQKPNRSNNNTGNITAELVGQCIRKVKGRKAIGLDCIRMEDLVHAQPRLDILLSSLFNQAFEHD